MFQVKISFYTRWCIFCLAGILVFGAYNYIQNFQNYNNFIGPQKQVSRLSDKINLEKAYLNALRLGYEACDFRGLPEPLESYLFDLKESFGKRYLSNENIKVKYVLSPVMAPFSFKSKRQYHEDFGWFGIVGVLLYFPTAIWFFLRVFYKFKFTMDERWCYVFIAIFFFIFICFTQIYDSFKGRYFILPMAFIAPIAISFTKMKNKKLIIFVGILISLASAITSVNATIKNRRKPLIPVTNKIPNNILNADYYQRRAGFVLPRMVPIFRFIEKETRPGDRIGHVCTLLDWDYPFFARDFSREVIPIKKSELKKGGTRVMEENELDFLIISMKKSKAHISFDLALPAIRKNRFFGIITKSKLPKKIK
jgi:hypothetical protein